jgi:hypothetical protein
VRTTSALISGVKIDILGVFPAKPIANKLIPWLKLRDNSLAERNAAGNERVRAKWSLRFPLSIPRPKNSPPS